MVLKRYITITPQRRDQYHGYSQAYNRNTVAHITGDRRSDLMKVLVKEAVQAFLEERWIHALERTVQTTDADLDTTQILPI